MAKKQITLTPYENEMVEFIKQNMDVPRFFIAQVAHVSKSGMSRRIKFAILKDNKLVNVTDLVAMIGGYSMKEGALTIGGCGMDMIFAALLGFASGLKMPKSAHEYAAVQHYDYF